MDQREMFGSAAWVSASQAKKDDFFMLRGKFNLGQNAQAMLRVLGLGFFHCYINGKRVGEDLFLPLNSEYEARENYPAGEQLSGYRIYVPEYDITPFLRSGENQIEIHFGGGWYTFEYEGAYYGEPKAIWRIFGQDEQGKFDFGSSEQDCVRDSFVGQYYFTQHECHFYNRVNADGGEWRNAALACPPKTEYEFSNCPADRIQGTREVKLLGEWDGVRLYDCGANISGWPVIRLKGKRDDQVKIAFSEELCQDTLDERFRHGQYMCLTSDGIERTVRPLFTWFAFRYFTVEGDAEVLSVEVVRSNVSVTASFESDNLLLNWIHDTFLNTQLDNMHAGIPSDCPHIERRGYTGDGQLICHAAMNVLDGQAFYKKWMQDIADGQDIHSGHIQYTAPYVRSGGGPGGWGCAIVEVPYQYYRHYGDASVLEKYYPAMLRYFDYLDDHSVNDLVVSDKAGEWCLGDWCPPVAVILPAPYVNNYFYIKSLMRCVEIAKLIGREADIPGFEKKIESRKAALMAAYFNAWDGNFLGNRQGANAFAVDIGLGDERTYRNLVKFYREEQGYDTGIFGTDIVTRVLFEHGDGQVATDLILSESVHSFDAMHRAGATTLWEDWPNSVDERSHNHPMFGAVVAYFYDSLAGIRDLAAGYREIEIAPAMVKQVNHLSVSRMLPAGRVSVSYARQDGQIAITVELPQGLPAALRFDGQRHELVPGKNCFTFPCAA